MPYVRSHPRTYRTHEHERVGDYSNEDEVAKQNWENLPPIEKSITYPFFGRIEFDLDRYLDLRQEYSDQILQLVSDIKSSGYSIDDKKSMKRELKEYAEALYELEKTYEKYKLR